MNRILIIFGLFIATQANGNIESGDFNQSILNAYYDGISTYAEYVETCDEKKAPILPENLFQGFDLTKVEMQTVFNYYRSKAFIGCSMSGLNNYVLHATLLRVKAPTDHAKKMLDASDELITYSYIEYLEQQLKYKELSKSVRNKVEKIPELQKLFNAIDSYENLSKAY